MIVCRLKRLRFAAEEKQGRKIPYRVLAQEAGLAYSTVARLASGKTDRADFSTLDALCRYFRCGVGDILEHVES